MSEHIEFDVQAYDREIGVEAAFSLNGLYTLRRLGPAEDQLEHLDELATRLEETAERHIGRKPENETLFVGVGAMELAPILREPWSPAAAEAQLSDEKLEELAHNKVKISSEIYALVEPYHTSFLDKLPLQNRKRWYERTPKTITWREQDTHLSYEFEITPNTNGSVGFSRVSCRNIGVSYEFGVRGIIDARQGRITAASITWQNHIDYGDAPQIIERKTPGLWDTIKEKGIEYGWSNQVIVNFDEMSLTIRKVDSYPSSSTYRYDADKNLLVNQGGKTMSPEEFLKITEQVLCFMPTAIQH